MWSQWVKDLILVQNYGGMMWENNFWYFGESRFSPWEAPNIEFLFFKKDDFAQNYLKYDQFTVEFEKKKKKKKRPLLVTDQKKK